MTFQVAIDSTESAMSHYLALNQPRFDPEAIPARRRFLNRRLKLMRNLIGWRKYAGNKYGVDLLAMRLLEQCMLPAAESGWEVGGEESLRKVRAMITDVILYADDISYSGSSDASG